MTGKNIRTAMEVAQEFIKVVRKMEDEDSSFRESYTSPRTRGELRRKSLDLSRALADMRKADSD